MQFGDSLLIHGSKNDDLYMSIEMGARGGMIARMNYIRLLKGRQFARRESVE